MPIKLQLHFFFCTSFEIENIVATSSPKIEKNVTVA